METQEVKKGRGRPAGAKNAEKFDAQGNRIPLKDAQGNRIPLKSELAATKVPGKRGRPLGSKNDKAEVKTVEVTQVETSTVETVLPIGSL